MGVKQEEIKTNDFMPMQLFSSMPKQFSKTSDFKRGTPSVELQEADYHWPLHRPVFKCLDVRCADLCFSAKFYYTQAFF